MVLDANKAIVEGNTSLGIEFGSTRIKSVLVAFDGTVLASGSFDWENSLQDGIWTYSIEKIITGMQTSYSNLVTDVEKKYGILLEKVGSIGVSAMMHGYMAFDEKDNLLVPFRTWRNTITGEAADKLTSLFEYPIPQRWSIAHLYQAILNNEEHVSKVSYFTTLAGYIHYILTGEKVLGIGDASGMFPIDTKIGNYNADMIKKFDALIADKYDWKLEDILPRVLMAGDNAGTLTEEGAKLLDISGKLCAGIPICPPEGDAGTGMVATNSIEKRTGNISAGTSVFAMVVLEKELSKVYDIIDLVTTPSGDLVAMVHCNNCTSDINAWVNLFDDVLNTFGADVSKDELYTKLFEKSLEGDADCGGLLSYNYFSGEPVTGFDEGRPLFVRKPDARFSLSNFMRMNLYSSLGALKVGMDILLKEEKIQINRMFGHGGLYKTPVVGQRITAAALNSPVSVMQTAGEGGAWGIAILAAYMASKKEGESLSVFLEENIFKGAEGSTVEPIAEDVEGFDEYMKSYSAGLEIERAAVAKF